jgi:hypothetical protein
MLGASCRSYPVAVQCCCVSVVLFNKVDVLPFHPFQYNESVRRSPFAKVLHGWLC